MKGVSQAVYVVLLMSMTVGAVGTIATTIQSSQRAVSDSTELLEDPKYVSLESTWETKRGVTNASVRNEADYPTNLTFIQGGEVIAESYIPPNEVRPVTLGCLNRKQELKLVSPEFEDSRFVDAEPGYCIEITDTHIRGDLSTYRVWDAVAYENNFRETPYSNKNVRVTIDGQEKIIETDENGTFNFSSRWDTEYIQEGGKWKRVIEYDRSANRVDFHRGSGKFQPPNRIRMDFENGNSQVMQTQEVFQEVPSSDISMKYDIIPTAATDSYLEFNVTVRLEAKGGLEQDWNDHSSSSDLMYQMPVPSGGSYAEVLDLSCHTSNGVKCRTGSVYQKLESDTGQRRFQRSELPSSGGDKYMPVEMNVTTGGEPFLGSLTSFSYFRYDNDWKRFRVDERNIYVPPNSESEYVQSAYPERVDNLLESRFGDSAADAERNYYQRFGLTSTIGGWWNAPVLSRGKAMFALEDSVEHSGGPGDDSIPAVTYNWTDVQSGKTYDLNYTVRLKREPSTDRSFMLPVNLGTFGMFPADGGRARHIYNQGGVRYPPYGSTGWASFSMNIPAQDSSEALVYKITLPEEGDSWRAKTYVVNTGESRIENIFLLNSQGVFHEFENSLSGGDISAGETISKKITLENNPEEKVQLNMQFQTIDGSIEYPEYTDWPYDASLDVKGETDYSFDISGSVSCNTRYCLSYRTGNREEAEEISDLRESSASRSLFDQNVDSVKFTMTNDDPDAGTQSLKNLGFWVWYMQPFDDNLQTALTRPDRIEMETIEGKPELDEGRLVKTYE